MEGWDFPMTEAPSDKWKEKIKSRRNDKKMSESAFHVNLYLVSGFALNNFRIEISFHLGSIVG
jgi:hypothetical protein